MKMLALLSLSLAVAVALPPFPPDVAQSPDLIKEEQSPLLGDWVPVQGHVEVEHPAPQARLRPTEQQEKMAPVPVNMDQMESQSMVELEVKVKPEVKVEQESKVKTDAKLEPEVKAEPEVKVEQAGIVKLEVKVKPNVKEEQEQKAEPEVQTEPEVNLNPEVMEDLDINLKPEVEMEQELKADPDFKVGPEAETEPDIQEEKEPEEKPVLSEEQEVQEEFPTLMILEAETEIGQEVQERHIDMERSEMVGEPIMQLEPLDDDTSEDKESDTDLLEVEKSLKEEEEEQGTALDKEPIMDLETKMRKELFLNQGVMPKAATMEEGPALDFMGNPIPPLEDYFPNEEARMEMELSDQDSLTEDFNHFMMEEPGSEESPVEGSPVLDGGAQTGVLPKREKRSLLREGVQNPVERLFPKQEKQATGQSCCPGVVLEGKCYQFFKGPKRAEDAEFFCQEHFPGGHLASITSQHIHREVMNMMLKQNGAYTRTWIGGLRYLKTGRFIWLDGSHWGYADWLSGEPNNTLDVENCLEVLALGNGKFNDFTCWEPQAFICSYQYQ